MIAIIEAGQFQNFQIKAAKAIKGIKEVHTIELKGHQYNRQARIIEGLKKWFDENPKEEKALWIPANTFVQEMEIEGYLNPCKGKKDFSTSLPFIVERKPLTALYNSEEWQGIQPKGNWRSQYAAFAKLKAENKEKELILNGLREEHKPLEKVKGKKAFILKDAFGDVEGFLIKIFGKAK